MQNLEERALIYTSLFLICMLTAGWIGLAAGSGTFVIVMAVIELLYFIADRVSDVHTKTALTGEQ